MSLFNITARNASHARKENRKLVIYRNNPRPGERGDIELPDQVKVNGQMVAVEKSPQFRHLGLVRVIRGNVRTEAAPAKETVKASAKEGDGDDKGDAARALLNQADDMPAVDFRNAAAELLGEPFGNKGAAVEALEAVASPLAE